MTRDTDSTRKKIGVDRLSIEQRKKLFQEFIEHGGKVIKEKKSHKARTIQRPDLSREKVKKEIPEKRTIPLGKKHPLIPPPQIKSIKHVKNNIRKKSIKSNIIDFTRIYLKGLSYKIFTLSGNRLNDNFINYINKRVKDAFVNLNLSLYSILASKSSVKRDVIKMSTSENSTFYEFLIRLNSLYNEKEFVDIYRIICKKTIPKLSYMEIFKKFFKNMYILGQYIEISKMYIEKAIGIQENNKIIDKNIVPNVKAQLKKDIELILSDFLPKFHIILCKMNKRYYPLYSQKLDDFLEITDKDRIGYITQTEKERMIEALKMHNKNLTKQREKAEDIKEIKVPKHIKRGLPLIEEAINKYERLHQEDVNNPIFLMDKNDKLYKSAIIFEVFDNEYSFILTTGKITFNIDYREQKKVDIKEDLSQVYIVFNEAREEINEYLDIIKGIKNTQENIRLTIHQQHDMLEKLSRKRSVLSKQARLNVVKVMKNIESTLSLVITDYNSTKRLLQNADEILFFDKNIEGEKKLDGNRIIKAIIEAFLFASTFAFLLKFGELSGSGIFIEENKAEN